MTDDLHVGFVTGTTPDKWARAWREQRRGTLTLVPVREEEQEDAVRAREGAPAPGRPPVYTDDLHVVRLYDEQPVVVASRDHFVAAGETVSLADLTHEQLVRPNRAGCPPA